jgi:hypothetical protein
MATFRIGMRVRIVGTACQGLTMNPTGKEGVITKAGAIGAFTMSNHDWAVMTDDGWDLACDSCELEPIRYDGMQPVSWESMKDLWQPEGVEA